MPDGITKANVVEHFKKLLETETDSQKRAVIKRKLAEEDKKLVALLKARGERKRG